MLQGYPPSPVLFNLFMDGYITLMNTDVYRGVSILFVDDVLLLTMALIDIQRVVCSSNSWAENFRMKWGIQNSCGLRIPGISLLGSETLPDKYEETYLGVSFGPRRVTDRKLVERLNSALTALRRQQKTAESWRLSVKQRRDFVKNFVITICAYLTLAVHETKSHESRRGVKASVCIVYSDH